MIYTPHHIKGNAQALWYKYYIDCRYIHSRTSVQVRKSTTPYTVMETYQQYDPLVHQTSNPSHEAWYGHQNPGKTVQ